MRDLGGGYSNLFGFGTSYLKHCIAATALAVNGIVCLNGVTCNALEDFGLTDKLALLFLTLIVCLPMQAAANKGIPKSLTQVPSHDCLHEPLIGTPSQKKEFRQCLDGAAKLYSISPAILVSIKRTESGLRLNPAIENKNTNGTTDISLMQVNYEVWDKELKKLGISLPRESFFDTCNNLVISGWILRKHLDRFGGDAFEAVGRYHSGTPHLKKIYQSRLAKQARAVVTACSQ